MTTKDYNILHEDNGSEDFRNRLPWPFEYPMSHVLFGSHTKYSRLM